MPRGSIWQKKRVARSTGVSPNNIAEIATFAASNVTEVLFSATTTIDRTIFDPGADAFTISITAAGSVRALELGGVGLTNNSGVAQSFSVAGDALGFQGFISFFHRASVGQRSRRIFFSGSPRHSATTAARSATFTRENSACVQRASQRSNAGRRRAAFATGPAIHSKELRAHSLAGTMQLETVAVGCW